jgi:hypothetical protein
MSSVLVWPLLYRGVVAQFAEDGTDCENYFGWRGPTLAPKAPGLRKISWVPGDDKGLAGKLLPPVQTEGQTAQSIATFDEQFTLYFFAVDTTNLADEEKQYTAARLLFDAWVRAMKYAALAVGTYGRFTILTCDWVVNRKEKTHGACLRALCTAQAKIPDSAYVFAPVDTTAELDGQLDDFEGNPLGGIVETQTITKDDPP